MLISCEEQGEVKIYSRDCDAIVKTESDSFFARFHTFICEEHYIGYNKSNSVMQAKFCKYVEYSGTRCKTLYYYGYQNSICNNIKYPYYDQESGGCSGCPESDQRITDDNKCSNDYIYSNERFINERFIYAN